MRFFQFFLPTLFIAVPSLLGVAMPEVDHMRPDGSEPEHSWNERVETPMRATSSDEEITQRILRDINANTRLSNDAKVISIITEEGKVTLSGRVPSESERDELVKTTQEQPGVNAVVNKIRISGRASAAGWPFH